MLKINHSLHFPVPHQMHSTSHLVLSPVSSDGDELIEAIERDHQQANWTLDSTPDVQQLDEFWTHVEDDLKKDPDWFDFAND